MLPPPPARLQGIPSVARAVITEDDALNKSRTAAALAEGRPPPSSRPFKLLVEGYDLLAVMGTLGVKVRQWGGRRKSAQWGGRRRS